MASCTRIQHIVDQKLGFEEAALVFARGIDYLYGFATLPLDEPLPEVLTSRDGDAYSDEKIRLLAKLTRLAGLNRVEQHVQGNRMIIERARELRQQRDAVIDELKWLRTLVRYFDKWVPAEPYQCVRRVALDRLVESINSAVAVVDRYNVLLREVTEADPSDYLRRRIDDLNKDLEALERDSARGAERLAQANEWLQGLRQELRLPRFQGL